MFFLQAAADNTCDIFISFICDDTFGVIIHFLFCFGNDCFYIWCALHLSCNLVITFKQFNCIESLLSIRNIRTKKCFNIIQISFDFIVKLMYSALNSFGLSSLNNCIGCFLDTCILQSRNLIYRTAAYFTQFLNVDVITILLDKVHHVDGHNNRNTKFHKLCCQIKITLKVRTINDVEDRIRFLVQNIISCNNFLKCIWRK